MFLIGFRNNPKVEMQFNNAELIYLGEA